MVDGPIVVLSLLWLLPTVWSGQTWWADLLDLLPNWLLTLGAFGLGVLSVALGHNRWKALLLILLATLFAMGMDVVYLNVDHSDESLRVLQWNLQGWEPGDGAMGIMESVDADVYLLQEVADFASAHQSELEAHMPEYQVLHRGEFLIVSRFEIRSSELMPGVLKAEIVVNGDGVTLANVHVDVPAPLGSERDRHWQSLRTTDFEGRTVLAGDFNASRTHPWIEQLRRHFTLSNPQENFAIVRTWPSIFPLLRVDYGFFSEGFEPTAYRQICRPSLSDHCAVLHAVQVLND